MMRKAMVNGEAAAPGMPDMLDMLDMPGTPDMPASAEAWIEAHLTPSGWTYGSYKNRDAHPVLIPAPHESLLTMRRHFVEAGGAAPRRLSEIRATRANSAREIARLLETFGEPHFNMRPQRAPRARP
ncbi:hypothetical protein ACKI2N_024815 [Cupriavidus sp. 30B13]|uniref:hypothetical protein n=1 Tax=Cupriavidus sp. 30B13 TaxID=3384241 RepID=UPI003B9003D3